ncbi:MAG: hypothetical protein EB025_06575, partial [Chitinophagaceae bacterium]|nr:hypothetical protein [Chitinophagaceae bacterium]
SVQSPPEGSIGTGVTALLVLSRSRASGVETHPGSGGFEDPMRDPDRGLPWTQSITGVRRVPYQKHFESQPLARNSSGEDCAFFLEFTPRVGQDAGMGYEIKTINTVRERRFEAAPRPELWADAPERDWNNWIWQQQKRIKTMEQLEKVIQPTLGVLTNIGTAHNEGFISMEEKEKEKRKLFRSAPLAPALQLNTVTIQNGFALLQASGPLLKEGGSITIPFTDEASIQNALRCWEVLLALGIPLSVIAPRMKKLTAVDMRLHLKKGINNCQLINDAYSADLSSLEIALTFLKQQGGSLKRTVILSDFLESGESDAELYAQIAQLLQQIAVHRLITIGPRIRSAFSNLSGGWQLEQYVDTTHFIQQFEARKFQQEVILIKGARSFALESIVPLLEEKIHATRLEIDLNAVVHNLNEFRQQLSAGTRLMAMVKAFAYGSGASEIAHVLQFQGVDYFGVAYADEGVSLRQVGITKPIMVMNTEEPVFDAIYGTRWDWFIWSGELYYSIGATGYNTSFHHCSSKKSFSGKLH